MAKTEKPLAVVVDTTGLLAGYTLTQLSVEATLYTTPANIDEVKDSENKMKLETMLSTGILRVASPPPTAVRLVEKVARELGENVTLSKTDIMVLALALHLRHEGYDVVLVSDDYAVQNLALKLGIRFMPLRTRGIRGGQRYIVMCKACGFQPPPSYRSRICPRCGHRLSRVRI